MVTAPGDRVFAHDDERAVIYEIDHREERLVKAFAMGGNIAPGDFEGVAYARDRFYLVTSSGRLYESREGEDDERVLFNTYGTGVGESCEVEGLTYEPADETLLLLCKTARSEAVEDHLAVFRWALETREITSDSPWLIPLDPILERIDRRSFHPSGIDRHPESGHYFIVAAQQTAIVEITPAGDLVGVTDFRRRNHRQVEGIAFVSDGTLLLADEGGNGRARLTWYRPGR